MADSHAPAPLPFKDLSLASSPSDVVFSVCLSVCLSVDILDQFFFLAAISQVTFSLFKHHCRHAIYHLPVLECM